MIHKNYSLVLSRKGKSTKAESIGVGTKKACVFTLFRYLFVAAQLPSCVSCCTPWTAACQASLSFTIFLSLLKLMSTESAMPSNHLILCRSLLLLPSVFPRIRVFSSETASGSQGIRASASASVLPLDSQGRFPLGLTGLIQWMLAIWSLLPLPFPNPACTSGRCTYCWSLAWRILSITLPVCEKSTLVW